MALGGGWDTTLLPTQVQLMKGFSLLPKLESTPPAIEAAPSDTAAAQPAKRAASDAVTAALPIGRGLTAKGPARFVQMLDLTLNPETGARLERNASARNA